MKNTLIGSSVALIGIIVVAILATLGFNAYMRQTAIDQCFQIAKVQSQTTSGDSTKYTTTYTLPVSDWYTRCMKEKGYK